MSESLRSIAPNRSQGFSAGTCVGKLMFFTFKENLTIWALYAEPGCEKFRMPLKDSIETKMGCQERRGGRIGSWSMANRYYTPSFSYCNSFSDSGSHV
ncbi:hypothetical protein L1987_16528 [Smallanthus sonchifolius]|uniref:Uncharacterized protein n=1 Tax=Smallanthus sonchifolius TaxID=185202 RepID=A0ACB9JA43_9ASTR|nr:hypothetical protein L1987_16528 [Smallanthus sonchifolius]